MFSRSFWLYCLLLLSCSSIFGESTQKLSHKLTDLDLKTFFDELIPMQIEQANIAGAVVAVVKDGCLVFSKGYGYADVARKAEISTDKTLFRPGSISKLFTWTAAMQLVEQGKLDLDRDINDYLDFKIAAAFDKPITLRDLMTHRSGFEETIKDLFVKSEADLHSLSHYLQTHMPSRIYPPGETPAYSNFGATIAGYLVERVSGLNFNEYVEENILKPLQMHHSTFRQPLQDGLKPFISQGYLLASDEPRPFELVQAAPAGSLSTSAKDMANFMIMHLQEGRYLNQQIIKPETSLQMHARQDGWPQEANAMCLGFYEQSQNGYRIIGHEGHTLLFHSKLFLNLDANMGLFVSYNSAGESKLDPCAVLVDMFMDRFYPEATSKNFDQPLQSGQSVVGCYQLSRCCKTTLMAVSSLFLEATVSTHSKNNTLSMTGLNDKNGLPLQFREIAPRVFHQVDGKGKIVFASGADGRQIAYVDYNTHYPSTVFQQVSNRLDKQNFNFLLLGFSLSVVVLTLLTWPIGFMIRKYFARPLVLTKDEKKQRRMILFTCLCSAVYVAMLLSFALSLNDLSMLSERNDFLLRLLQFIGWLAVLGSLTMVYHFFRYLSYNQKGFWHKIWKILPICGCAGFCWFIYYWNLLSLSLSY